MKTLYEILEVSENASKEIIEKAYRVLAKRYHPDLQKEEDKLNAEKKMKEINEAYSILSNDEKRKEYNEKLAYERQKEQESKLQYAESDAYYQSQSQNYNNENIRKEEYQSVQKRKQEEIKNRKKMQEDLQAQYEQKYQNAYENYLKSLGYKIKYKWTWKDYKKFFIIILVFIAICTGIWFFPPTNKMLIDFYNSNPLIKTVIDIIIGIIRGIWNALCSTFTSFS